jgi:hypothetical protein
MKKLLLIFYFSIMSNFSAASEIEDVILSKVEGALQCVSEFGKVSNVQVTGAEKIGSEFAITGRYVMVGFWGKAPGNFKGTMDYGLNLTYLRWEEPNDSGVVRNSCLN